MTRLVMAVVWTVLLFPGALRAWQLPVDSVYRRSPGFVSPDGPYRPSGTKAIDLLHTSLKLGFDWAKQEVAGQAVLAVKPHFYPQDSVILDARAFQVREVLLVGSLPAGPGDFDRIEGIPLRYRYDRLQLRIQLDKTYGRNDTAFIAIRYTAHPTEAEKLSFDGVPVEKGLYFINPDGRNPHKPRQLWTQGETTGGSSWFPTLETPNEKFTQDFFLTVEDSQVSVSNGILVSQTRHPDGLRTDHWRQSLPHAPYLAAIAVGAFSRTVEKAENGMEVSYYVDPAYAPYASLIFGRTPEMISFFSKRFDTPYPWDKYAQVIAKDFVSGAMENTTVTILQEETQMTRRELIDGNSDALIAHELAHHWFGNLVTCEEWGQLPLNESFANYAEYLWTEYKQGKEEADWSAYLEMQEYFSESQTKNVKMIRYFYQNPDQMFDSHSYAKGGRILHMLRHYTGDEAFFASLSLYLKKKKFGTAELADLRMAFEEVTGEDLNWFFDQWFFRPGHPGLTVSHHYLPAPGKLSLKVRQVQDTLGYTVYRLPVDVDIWVKGNKTRKQILVDRTSQEFSISLEEAPDLVLLDPDGQLLGTISHEKTTEEWLFQFENDGPFPARYEALKQLGSHLNTPAVRKSLLKALRDPFWKIRQEAVFQFAGFDAPGKKEAESLLREMAAHDDNPQVRGEALLALESMNLPDFKNEIRKALNDSSYAVVSTAIGLMAKNSPKEMKGLLPRFRDTPNEFVAAAVGDYFGDNPEPGHFDWFTGMMNRLSPSGCYALMQAFGKYLVRSGPDIQQKGISFLESQARNHSGMSVRYGAYQLISWFDDKPGIRTMLQEIRAQERDQRLLSLYGDLETGQR